MKQKQNPEEMFFSDYLPPFVVDAISNVGFTEPNKGIGIQLILKLNDWNRERENAGQPEDLLYRKVSDIKTMYTPVINNERKLLDVHQDFIEDLRLELIEFHKMPQVEKPYEVARALSEIRKEQSGHMHRQMFERGGRHRHGGAKG